LFSKLHIINGQTLLACADNDLIGKKLKEKEIEVTISESFYKDFPCDEIKLKKLLKEANSINLFGNKCVKIALEEGIISKEDIIKINGYSHAQIYRL